MNDDKSNQQTAESEATIILSGPVEFTKESSTKESSLNESQAQVQPDPVASTVEPAAAEAIDEPASSVKPEAKSQASTSQSSRAATSMSALALILALVAVAGAAWLYQDNQQASQTKLGVEQNMQSLRAEFNQLKQQVATQADSVTRGAKQIASMQQQQQGLLAQIDATTALAGSNEQRIKSVARTERRDWQLAEVEYLLRLANQRLLMSGEVTGSKALLQAADAVLLELNDMSLFEVRQAIGADIAALNSAGQIDIEGLFARLNGLKTQVGELRIQTMPQWQPAPLEEQTPQDVAADMLAQAERGLQIAWQKLRSLIVVKTQQERPLPQVSPDQESQLQQGLKLLIEQAKYAAISGRTEVYQDALAQMREWLDLYYGDKVTGASALQAMITEIAALQERAVTVELPDIRSSLKTLQDYLRAQNGALEQRAASEDN